MVFIRGVIFGPDKVLSNAVRGEGLGGFARACEIWSGHDESPQTWLMNLVMR
jgi:hypothetical protein